MTLLALKRKFPSSLSMEVHVERFLPLSSYPRSFSMRGTRFESIQTQNGKRKERSCLLEGGEDRLRAFREHREAFGPSRRHIGQSQGVQIASLRVLTTMGDQIRFQETGSGSVSDTIPIFV